LHPGYGLQSASFANKNGACEAPQTADKDPGPKPGSFV